MICHISSGAGATSIPYYWYQSQISSGRDVKYYATSEFSGGIVRKILKGLSLTRKEKKVKGFHIHHALPCLIIFLSRCLFLTNKPYVVSVHRSFHHLSFGAKVCHILSFFFARTVIANSKATLDTFPHFFLRKSVYIYNGTDISSFEERNSVYKNAGEILNLLFVGRAIPEKNVINLLNAVRALGKEGAKCRLRVVGDGPLLQKYKEFVASNDMCTDVFFLGEICREDVYKEMLRSDVLMIPSLTEGYCNVAVEGMAYGVPVVYTPAPALKEVIDGCGWQAAGFTSGSLVEVIKRFRAASKEEIDKKVEAGRDRVASSMSLENTLNEFDECYRRTLCDYG